MLSALELLELLPALFVGLLLDCTVTVQVSRWLSELVARIYVVPAPVAVTTPFESTVATLELVVVHLTPLSVAFVGVIFGVNWYVAPIFNVTYRSLKSTDVTAMFVGVGGADDAGAELLTAGAELAALLLDTDGALELAVEDAALEAALEENATFVADSDALVVG